MSKIRSGLHVDQNSDDSICGTLQLVTVVHMGAGYFKEVLIESITRSLPSAPLSSPG